MQCPVPRLHVQSGVSVHCLLTAIALIIVPALSLGAQPVHLGKTLADWQANLNSTQRQERLLAVHAIGEMAIQGQEGALDALIESYKHSDSAIRYWAVLPVSKITNPPQSINGFLNMAIQDEAPEVRVQAAGALIATGHTKEGLLVLETLLSHPNQGVRLHVVHTLDSIGEKAAGLTEGLKAALEDEFDYVQRVARHALWKLGERPCPYVRCK